MLRRDFICSAFATMPFLGLSPRPVGPREVPLPTPHSGWLEYVRSPTSENARNAATRLPAFSPAPVAAGFQESIDRHIGVLESAVTGGDESAMLLAFRLHSAVSPGGLRSYLNHVIGRSINVRPEAFLRLLHEHPHLIGNRKILLNLGIDFVDDFEAQDAEVRRRIRSVESVTRPDLARVRREVLESLYAEIYVCSH